MCFSATASFTASAVLTGLGIASIYQVKERSQLPFASIPIVFGVQQFFEGLLWLSLTHQEWAQYQTFAMYAFLVIAQMIWPTWLPMAFILFEKQQVRKNFMKIFLGTGLLIAGYFGFCLLNYSAEARIEHHHIFYDLDFPLFLIPWAAFLYVISTAAAPLVSTNRKINLIGLIIAAFYFLVRIWFQPNLISVWCFFGTTVGILIFLVMREYSSQKRSRPAAMSMG